MRSARKFQGAASTTFVVGHGHVLVIAALIFAVSGSVAADAATISNRDDKEQTITIIEGATQSDRKLKPLEVIEKICLKGCVIRLNASEDDEYQIEGEDVVSIEDGSIYYDTPAEPQDPKAAPAPTKP